MHQRLDTDTPRVLEPIEASRVIGESYVRYLKARYAPANDDLRSELHDALDNGFLSTRGPFVQAAAAYQKGRTLAALISEGLMHRRLRDLDPDVLSPERPLYRHQEMAALRGNVG